MDISPQGLKQNQLLAVLPKTEIDLLIPHLELVSLPLGTLIYEPNKSFDYAYFPTTSIVSLHFVTASGASAETAGVGHEGIVGIALILGGNTMASSAMVRSAGYAYRIKAKCLQELFNESDDLRLSLLRYTQSMMTQIIQTAACYRHHSVEQQLSRWLLLTIDRLPNGELVMTQELIAYMLGVRRAGIAEAAGKLQQLGFIRYRRGHITVTNRVGLQSLCCECYLAVKNELLRISTLH